MLLTYCVCHTKGVRKGPCLRTLGRERRSLEFFPKLKIVTRSLPWFKSITTESTARMLSLFTCQGTKSLNISLRQTGRGNMKSSGGGWDARVMMATLRIEILQSRRGKESIGLYVVG